MELLLQSADETGLANDPEFRSALVGYLEWGSRIAVINSEKAENPIDQNEPMPKWGWGETGGPYTENFSELKMKNIDSYTHVRGESIYLDDIPVVNGTLFAAVFDSPVAHGKIISLDTQ